MSPRREASSEGRWQGVLNLLKPPGMTSHEVVACLRKWLRMSRIGHAGTLDPAACGVLVVCLGRATRLVEWLTGSDKGYRAAMTLGVRTDSQDITGRVLHLEDARTLRQEDLLRVLPRFIGPIQQVPPMASAKKYQGRRLYEWRREGRWVEREPQTVTIHDLQLVDFIPGPQPQAWLDVTCSKGTYIRTLCADIGEALDCGATLSFLLRTRVGPYELRDSHTLEEIESALTEGTLGTRIIPLDQALPHLPSVTVGPQQRKQVAQGQRISSSAATAGADLKPGSPVCLRDPGGALLAVGIVELHRGGIWYQPRKVLVTP